MAELVVRAVKGMNDVVPGAAEPFLSTDIWNHVFRVSERVLEAHGYEHVRLPTVEETTLFARGIGEDTDIVAKEMYTFTDRGERSLTLRPEGTAGAVRAYLEHGFARTDPVQKWWYAGPMFRAERPQKGRYRQFYQIGAELFGISEPTADAEMLVMLWDLCQALGLDGIEARVNTLGDGDSRARYRDVLKGYLLQHTDALCESCRKRTDTNPLRFLDCKAPGCRALAAAAPELADSLSDGSRQHFARVTSLLDATGIPYVRDPRLVRGLDYYTETTFEFTTTALGAQDAVLGGGRYNELVEELGGPATPAVGFAAGVERLALLVAAKAHVKPSGPHLYIVPMTGLEAQAMGLARELRSLGGWKVEVDVTGRKVKAQMKRADKVHARFALVLGEDEVMKGRGSLKDLGAHTELEVGLTGAGLHEALCQVCG